MRRAARPCPGWRVAGTSIQKRVLALYRYVNTRQGAAALSIASNTTLIVFKVLVAGLTGSVSVLSEAIHSGVDLLAAIIAFFSIRTAQRPADQNHPYGHGKAETLSAAIEALLIVVAAALIIYEALRRLVEGAFVENVDYGIGVMALSSTVNYFVSRNLFRVAHLTHSAALEADAWHLRTDVYTGVGVGVGLLLVRLTGITALDPFAALGVALLIVRAAWDITRRAARVLLDESLPARDETQLRAILAAHTGLYSRISRVRTRRGPQPYVEVGLEFPPQVSLPEAHALTEHLEEEIRRTFPHAVAVVEAEPQSAVASPETIIQGVRQLADRLNSPVHHVAAHRMGPKFHVNLHLEVEGSLSLGEAHVQATQLESEIYREIPAVAAVTTHIEPRDSDLREVDAAEADFELVAGQLQAIVQGLPQVRNVHDVDVHRQNGQLFVSLHCALEDSISLDAAHWVSSQIEAQLKRRLPAVASTFVHTEPDSVSGPQSGSEPESGSKPDPRSEPDHA